MHVVAEAACNLRAPVSNFVSHGEAADNVDQGPHPPYDAPWAPDPSPYGPLSTWERWDLHVWIDPTTRALFPPKGAPIPQSALYLPDYIRGAAALLIQDLTRHLWNPTHSVQSHVDASVPAS